MLFSFAVSMAYRFDELDFLEIHQIVPHKKIKTGFRPFLLIQVDLLVDREILSVHVDNHKKKINSTPHIHTQNLRLDKRRDLCKTLIFQRSRDLIY